MRYKKLYPAVICFCVFLAAIGLVLGDPSTVLPGLWKIIVTEEDVYKRQHKGRPYDMEWPDGACGMLPGYRAACLASPEKFVGADAHIGPQRPKPVKNQIRPVPSPSHLRRGRVCASLSGGFL